MKLLRYCHLIVLSIAILSNAIEQNSTSYEVEEDIDYGEPVLDYYPDSAYTDWKPFPLPGKKKTFYVKHFLLNAII
jgi:hypothetical protein